MGWVSFGTHNAEAIFYDVVPSRRMVKAEPNYMELSGSYLTKFSSKNRKPKKRWTVDLHNAEVTRGKAGEIKIQLTNGKKLVLASDDFETLNQWKMMLDVSAASNVSEIYVKERKIGEGSFGSVFLSTERKNGRKVAVKIVEKDLTTRTDLMRLQSEVKILGRVRHENVVTVFDIFDTPTHIHIAMEFMNGGTLDEYIHDLGSISEMSARNIVKGLLNAVEFLHSLRIVHRDLKPENILFSTDPLRVKIADFGFAKKIPEEDNEPGGGDDVFKTLLGTWNYVSPEQASRKLYGPKVDLWAVGVSMYEVLSGKLPFAGSSAVDIMKNIQDGNLQFPEEEWSHVSSEAQDMIKMLLTPEVSERPTATAAQEHPWLTEQRALTSQNNLKTPVGGAVTNSEASAFRSMQSEASNIHFTAGPAWLLDGESSDSILSDFHSAKYPSDKDYDSGDESSTKNSFHESEANVPSTILHPNDGQTTSKELDNGDLSQLMLSQVLQKSFGLEGKPDSSMDSTSTETPKAFRIFEKQAKDVDDAETLEHAPVRTSIGNTFGVESRHMSTPKIVKELNVTAYRRLSPSKNHDSVSPLPIGNDQARESPRMRFVGRRSSENKTAFVSKFFGVERKESGLPDMTPVRRSTTETLANSLLTSRAKSRKTKGDLDILASLVNDEDDCSQAPEVIEEVQLGRMMSNFKREETKRSSTSVGNKKRLIRVATSTDPFFQAARKERGNSASSLDSPTGKSSMVRLSRSSSNPSERESEAQKKSNRTKSDFFSRWALKSIVNSRRLRGESNS